MQSRWIGFSEDDGLIDRRRRRYDQAAEPQLVTQRVEDNPFHLYARACGASRIAPWLQHHPCYPRHPWLKIFCGGSRVRQADGLVLWRAGCNSPVSQAARLPLQPYNIRVNSVYSWLKKKKRQEDLHLPALFSVSGGNCLRRYFVPTTKVMLPYLRLIRNV